MDLRETGLVLQEKDKYGRMERHHIIFRSHGGQDYDLNLICLPMAFHTGPNGPHKNREIDLVLKLCLQDKLYEIFSQKYYDLKDIIRILEPHNKKSCIALEKQIKKENICTPKGYRREDIVRTLMGGKIYG